ncbi:hypoxanthine-guanine phosphoribosyltransferase [Sulfurisoma sediminicola]|uniref:Hypoxanthine phosphoribosyltransferase n=1 Tax=Sulfurisoma sediminicola TaxID=1381557 RepID=A0A497XCP5_9PROT|nr:hypoxanthine-guanine phosphoribosyltransferase [Sulfurisoma sediminicola]RLJ64703.1 hypoxanthine phosphoribosyltransferase [Sulfurisoma sediminicola]
MAPEEARRLLAEAELICPAEEVARAIDRLAAEISARLGETNPLVLTVMSGGIYFAGQLLPRLAFPLECDYLHATRYRNTTQGHDIEWLAEPRTPVAGRTVLLLDDILDEGITLAAIKQRLLAQGARECLTAVLTEKDLAGRDKPACADFVGLTLPDRYVFGCGMDVRGAWRNLPAIYAVKGL